MLVGRGYQYDAVAAIMDRFAKGEQRTLCIVGTGGGKCLGLNTPVIMFDGTIKMVQDIRVGDSLMGPDSLPRLVLSTCVGTDDMYRIKPKRGEPFTANGEHILCLRYTNRCKGSPRNGQSVDISINDYLKKNKKFKNLTKLFRVGVDFEHNNYLRLDPYFLGLWLGDGTQSGPDVTTADEEIVNFLREFAERESLELIQKKDFRGSKSSTYALTGRAKNKCNYNRIRVVLRDMGLTQGKRVPMEYRANDRATRLQVLAGLMDSDGCLTHSNSFEYVSKDRPLAEDVAFLARSLGLYVFIRECRKQCVNNGVWGTYWRVRISGNTDIVPTRIERKKAKPRRQKKDASVTGFNVESIGRDNYYGFEISGDGRFLLGDFTVTHNTLISAMLAQQFLNFTQGRVMFICHRDELIRQSAATLEKVTGERVDIEKADEWAREHDTMGDGKARIVVASTQTLMSGPKTKRRMTRFDPAEFTLMIADESHHYVDKTTWSDTIYHFCQNKNVKICGLTATGDRADGESLGDIFQSVAYRHEYPDLRDDGWLVPLRQRSVQINSLDFSRIKTVAGDFNQGELDEVMQREGNLHGIAHATLEISHDLLPGTIEREGGDNDPAPELFEKLVAGRIPKRTLLFCASVKHAELTADILNRWLPDSAVHVHGKMSDSLRAQNLASFKEGRSHYMCNVGIFTEGTDLPMVDIVVIGRPTKSRNLFSQMLGRVVRPTAAIAHLLGELGTAAERCKLIAESTKPYGIELDFFGSNGKHQLVTPLDILGNKASPEVLARAREICAEEFIDPAEALRRAEEDVARQQRESEARKRKEEEEALRRADAERARRAHAVGVASYTVEEYNASVPQFDLVPEEEFDPNKPTEGQLQVLRNAKFDEKEIAKLDRLGAGALCKEVFRRREAGLCTVKMARILERFGMSGECSFETGRERIDQLAKSGWKRPMAGAAR